jgi:hypothetical protein
MDFLFAQELLAEPGQRVRPVNPFLLAQMAVIRMEKYRDSRRVEA